MSVSGLTRTPFADRVSGRLPAQRRRSWRRAVATRRRLLVAGLLAAALTAGLHALAPPTPGTDRVLVAVHDLAAGATIAPGDVSVVAWRAGTAPSGAVSAAAGRVLASPLRRGEPVTDARLTGPGLLLGQPPGVRAVTVRLDDPAAAALLRPGDRVDVLAGATTASVAVPGPASADLLVEAALVLAVPGRDADSADGADSTNRAGAQGASGSGLTALTEAGSADPSATAQTGVVVLAVDTAAARRLAAASGSRSLSVALLAAG